MNILSIKAREILDSRGNWTIEVDLQTDQGVFRDSAPSGASTGKYEAKTVASEIAVRNVNEIVSKKLKGINVSNQDGIDKIIKNLNIGANATTAVSMAICRAGAAAKKLFLYQYVAELCGRRVSTAAETLLPRPCFNMINGGAHATNSLDFQEFMVVCDIKRASEIYRDLRKKLGKNVGDEGGFAPAIKTPEQALDIILRTFLRQEKRSPEIIIDAAASQFSDKTPKKYNLNYYENLIKKYPIIGLEDPFAENDWQNFKEITEKLGKKITIIGDDLLATNPERIKMAKEKNLCNAMILKVNQIGTISEALEAARLAKSYGWKIMVSHRSGETNDNFIADLAVGIGADYIKSGAPARGERVAKYNRLLEIEEELSNKRETTPFIH